MKSLLASLTLLAAFAPACWADGAHGIRADVQPDYPASMQAGDFAEIAVQIFVTYDPEHVEWTAFTGLVDAWFVDAVWSDETNQFEHTVTNVTLEAAAGWVQFHWQARVAGRFGFAFTLVEDEGAGLSQTPSISVTQGPISEMRVSQFESQMLLMEYEPDDELATALAPHIVGDLPPVAGSTTLFVDCRDEYGNSCALSGIDGEETSLDLTLDSFDLDGGSDFVGAWDLNFAASYIEDNGSDDDQPEVIEFYEADGDRVPDTIDIDAVLRAQMVPYFALHTGLTPRTGATAFRIRILGWATQPAPASSHVFSASLSITGTVAGVPVSGAGSVQAQLGTASATIATPYLVNYKDDVNKSRGAMGYYSNNGNSPIDQYQRWAGVAHKARMPLNANIQEPLYSNQPADITWLLTELWLRGLPGGIGAGANGFWGLPVSYHDSMGAPSTFGIARMVPDTNWSFLFDGTAITQGASRGWNVEVAFNKGSVQPSHEFEGKVRRYSAGFAQIIKRHIYPARIEAAWSTQGWGAAFDTYSQTLRAYEVSARHDDQVTTSLAIGLPPGIALAVGPTNAVSRLNHIKSYSEDVHNIRSTSLTMEAGFAVGFAADSNKGCVGCTPQHDMFLGWLDVVRIADPSKAQPSATGTIKPTNVNSEKDAWVRIGYSAPGTGGIIWTSAKWLR